MSLPGRDNPFKLTHSEVSPTNTSSLWFSLVFRKVFISRQNNIFPPIKKRKKFLSRKISPEKSLDFLSQKSVLRTGQKIKILFSSQNYAAGRIFETNNRAIFLERFFGRGILRSRAKNVARF